MDCYFYGMIRSANKKEDSDGVVSFYIPDLGVTFRAKFTGNQWECEYAGLLALLEFVELNPHLFKSKHLDIFGNSYLVVHQVNQKLNCTKELRPYLDMALVYKKKIPYTLSWIPEWDNPAQDQMTSR